MLRRAGDPKLWNRSVSLHFITPQWPQTTFSWPAAVCKFWASWALILIKRTLQRHGQNKLANHYSHMVNMRTDSSSTHSIHNDKMANKRQVRHGVDWERNGDRRGKEGKTELNCHSVEWVWYQAETKDVKCCSTCTSSPCSQHLCCTRPNICGTSLKPSPLNPGLSEIDTIAGQVLYIALESNNNRKYKFLFSSHWRALVSAYLVQLPDMILKKHFSFCV